MCMIISLVSESAKSHVVSALFADLDRSKSLEWEDLEKLTDVSLKCPSQTISIDSYQIVKGKRGDQSADHKRAISAMKIIWEGLMAYDVDGDKCVSLLFL